ncbi:MAG: deiodinase-like protein, partial [Pirellulaceae bacterium]
MYQTYKDLVEFRLIYIQEAHAADGRRPVDYAEEKNILEHKSYDDRCVTADMLYDEKRLTIPCLIDDMENTVNEAYQAHPDRIFLVRTDGKLAVAAAKGPFGFKPALDEVEDWLSEYKTDG